MESSTDLILLSDLQNTIDPIQKQLESVPLEELKYYFPKEVRLIDTLASIGYKNLWQIYDASIPELIKLPYFGGAKIRKINAIKDSIAKNVDEYLNAWHDSLIVHELPSNYDRSSGLSENLRNAIIEYAEIINDNLDNKRYITNKQQRDFFSVLATILIQQYKEGKSSDSIAEKAGYTKEYIDIIRNNCISEIIGGGVFFSNYRLNQYLMDLQQSVHDECLFDPVQKFEAYAGSSEVPLFRELGYDTVELLDVHVLIPMSTKKIYRAIWRVVHKILCDNPLPTDKDVIKQQIISNGTLSNINYDDTFIDKILNNDCFIDVKGQNLIQIKYKYLKNDTQRIARIVYESNGKITTVEIKSRYKEIQGRTIDYIPSTIKQYGISCEGKKYWYYGQPKESLQKIVAIYAEDKKEFYYDDIKNYIEGEGYAIPQAFRVYITNICVVDNKNKDHFCHKEYMDDYPEFSWRNPMQYGWTNWIFNEIKTILRENGSLPLQTMIDDLEERSQEDGYRDVQHRIQSNGMAYFCGEDKPFIICDGKVCVNDDVFVNTDFEIIGLRGEKYAFFKQIRSLVANEVKKKEDGRASLIDVITLVKNNINESLSRNTIIKAIKDDDHRFASIDVEIVKDNGVLYVQWLKNEIIPEPVYEVTSGKDTPTIEEVVEVKETTSRPSIKYRQGVNWCELNKVLKKELSFYGRWMNEEGIELNSAIDGFVEYLGKSPNENLNRILPQDLYEYWFASTDSYDRYRYLTDLLFMFEGLLTQLYYDQHGEKPQVHGLSNLAESFEGLPNLLLSSRDAQGFNRIASNLHYRRNKVAHGDFLEMSSVEMAQAITNYVALYVYVFAKYHTEQLIMR